MTYQSEQKENYEVPEFNLINKNLIHNFKNILKEY